MCIHPRSESAPSWHVASVTSRVATRQTHLPQNCHTHTNNYLLLLLAPETKLKLVLLVSVVQCNLSPVTSSMLPTRSRHRTTHVTSPEDAFFSTPPIENWSLSFKHSSRPIHEPWMRLPPTVQILFRWLSVSVQNKTIKHGYSYISNCRVLY